MDQNKTITFKATLILRGVVQGVGFRPFVARLAQAHGLAGQVLNEGGQVRVTAYGAQPALAAFSHDIRAHAPQGSRIVSLEQQTVPLPADEPVPTGFAIAPSGEVRGFAMPTPDIAVCDDCLRELATVGDPRYRNPFISCTHCGPRFTILRRLPYDRAATAMDRFPLCTLCAAQYGNPADRRFHAQTVCCNQCGPTLYWRGQDMAQQSTGETALQCALAALNAGGVIAIKGIGGYHLACDATREDAIAALRTLKGREQKPFAVMFASLASLTAHCFTDSYERALLTGAQKPIVLLRRRVGSSIVPGVYGESPYLGAFLPYTPLQALLLANTAPLVMTSGNPSGLPMITQDAQALCFAQENRLCAGVLYHDRAILRRADDSVAMVVHGQTLFLRRARGYAPLPVPFEGKNDGTVLALGAQQKSTVCLSAGGQMYPSVEIGDLANLETAADMRETAADMQALLGIMPTTAVCDLHPGYESTRFALATGLPVLQMQHHFAHIASVLAENGRRDTVIGVAFDGTGYGSDGTVWGGEFLLASSTGFTRVGHLKAIPYLGGDGSVPQGWKSAACLLYSAGLLQAGDDPRYPALLAALAGGLNVIHSSSMGRVFDGVSSLLGICHESGYEGQCAIALEYAATQADGLATVVELPFTLTADADGTLILDLAPCIRALVARRDAGESGETLALSFHRTVCRMTADACVLLRKRHQRNTVALSGGVFQNRLLLSHTFDLLQSEGFEVLTNHCVPPNDGGISLGQAYIARCTQTQGEVQTPCVSQ